MRVRFVAARANLMARLDGLGAGVGEEDPLDPGVRPGHELLGQDAGQQGAVHLHEVGQVGVEGVVQGLDDGRVAAAEGEHAEPGQEVEVAVALVVDEIAALALDVEAVELERAEHPGHLGVDVLGMEGEVLRPCARPTPSSDQRACSGLQGSVSGRWRQVSGGHPRT